MLRVLDLFSGIGGFSYGLEKTGGFETVAFCEIDPFCRAVISKHWPGVRIFDDICRLSAVDVANASCELRQRRGDAGTRGRDEHPDSGVDLICGGFPCQDLSVAGKGAGLTGARSGLWREYFRLICEFRDLAVVRRGTAPIVFVENVAALLSRGLGTVLGDLAAIGYDAEWHCIPASYVGAPHRRDRIWIVAHPIGHRLWDIEQREARRRERFPDGRQAQPRDYGAQEPVADADGEPAAAGVDPGAPEGSRAVASEGTVEPGDASGGRARSWSPDVAHATERGFRTDWRTPWEARHLDLCREDVADACRAGLEIPEREALLREGRGVEGGAVEQRGAPPDVADPDGDERHWRASDVQMGWGSLEREAEDYGFTSGTQWSTEPAVGELVNGVSGGLVRFNGRVAGGVQDRVPKLKALGNSIVPQIAEMIGRAILDL